MEERYLAVVTFRAERFHIYTHKVHPAHLYDDDDGDGMVVTCIACVCVCVCRYASDAKACELFLNKT